MYLNLLSKEMNHILQMVEYMKALDHMHEAR